MAARRVRGAESGFPRINLFALRQRLGAARMEMTTLRRVHRRGQIALQLDHFPLRRFFDRRHRRQQRARVGMPGGFKHLFHAAVFDDAPQIHHGHRIGQELDHRDIVRDEKISQPFS